MVTRALPLLILGLLAAACGGTGASPTSPSKAPALTFTATPNPVPYYGLAVGCGGATQSLDTWYYTLSITNNGSANFSIGSFSARVTSPLVTSPVDVPYAANTFAAAFGATTIAPQATVSAPLCVAGAYGSSTLTWTFVYSHTGPSFTDTTTQFHPLPITGGGRGGGPATQTSQVPAP